MLTHVIFSMCNWNTRRKERHVFRPYTIRKHDTRMCRLYSYPFSNDNSTFLWITRRWQTDI